MQYNKVDYNVYRIKNRQYEGDSTADSMTLSHKNRRRHKATSNTQNSHTYNDVLYDMTTTSNSNDNIIFKDKSTPNTDASDAYNAPNNQATYRDKSATNNAVNDTQLSQNNTSNTTSYHEVEYIEKGKNQKRPKTQKPHGKVASTLLTIAIILVIFLITILVADSIRGGYIMSEVMTIVTGSNDVTNSYYGVEIYNAEDIEAARIFSNEIRSQQGAGYVIKDNGYRVLVEVYEEKTDAESIVKKLKLDGYDARLYTFDIKRIDYLKFPEKSRNNVKSTVAFHDRILSSLYAIGLDLASENIDENTAIMRISGLKNETHNISEEFIANMDNDKNHENVIKIKAELKSIEAMLQNLSSDSVKRPNLLSDIRYTSCLVANSYRELTRELS